MLPIAWFRETVSQSVADSVRAEKTFVGSSLAFSGTTLRALDTALSGVGRYGWSIAFNPAEGSTELQYRASGQEAEARAVHAWAGSVAAFSYLDHHGKWHDVWPPTGIAAQLDLKKRPLPMMVALDMGGNAQVLAAIQDHTPPPLSIKALTQ